MACGKPVVNTDIDSGVPFVSLDGVTGITVAPGDVDALRHSINLLLADANLRAQYGAAARKRVETEFSRGAMLRRTRELYDNVLAGGGLHERAGHRRGVAAAT